VDWLWNSGTVAIKRVQEIVGVKVDGIVGDKTIAAINNKSPLPLFGAIKEARKEYIEEICDKRPKNEKFRRGWMNRVNDIMFEE
jgi:lysozyme family protein